MNTLEAVIFDLDGVLTETSRQHFMAWKQLAKDLGYELEEELNQRLKGISRMESLEIVLEALGIAEDYTYLEKVNLANVKNALYQSLIKQFTREDLSEGAFDLLVSLKENNIKIALASVSKNALFLLEAMGIKCYFDAIADPNQILQGKPAPDIFLQAASMIKVEPRNCVGIEDAFAGIESIKNAGMHPVGIGKREELYNCDIVVPTLSEITLEFLRSLVR